MTVFFCFGDTRNTPTEVNQRKRGIDGCDHAYEKFQIGSFFLLLAPYRRSGRATAKNWPGSGKLADLP